MDTINKISDTQIEVIKEYRETWEKKELEMELADLTERVAKITILLDKFNE